MTLDKIYKLGSKGIGVRFIQKVLNAEIKPTPLLVEDGIWGAKTADIVKQYQTLYGLKVDGIVGSQTMKSMILENPDIWDEIEYEYCIGVR
jgi:murein L,D-transpeptidase YcbB/YkuD